MSELQRNTLGAIWRLCQQMEYTAEHGMTEVLKAQYNTLSKYMARLDMIKEVVNGKSV